MVPLTRRLIVLTVALSVALGAAAPPATVAQQLNAPEFLVTASWLAQLGNRPGVVVVDMRAADAYAEGHIPGAFHFDRFRPQAHLTSVMAAAGPAQKVVVYCGGGDCEDSKYAALQLLQNGVDPGKVFVYMGGVKEWTQSGLPLERGQRGSGDLVQGAGQ